MFTDRFIKFPIKIFNREQKDLIGKEELEWSYEYILPMEISSYRETYDNENEHGINITMKSGETYFVYVSLEKFENILNKHQKQ